MKSEKFKFLFSLFSYLYIIISSIIIVILHLVLYQKYENDHWWDFLTYFTNLSNILICVTSIISFIQLIQKKRIDFNDQLLHLQYVAVVSGLIVVLIVALALAPASLATGEGYFKLFKGYFFFFHFTNPLLFTTIFFIQKKKDLVKKDLLFGVIPMMIYSILYILFVVILKVIPDLYNFTFGGRYYLIPVSFTLVYGISLIIDSVVYNIFKKKKLKIE